MFRISILGFRIFATKSGINMFIKSIRFKITLLYTVILAVTLTAFSLVLYQHVGHNLYSAMDSLLKSKAGGIVQAIDTYWEASTLEMPEGAAKPETLTKRRNVGFAKIAQKWAVEKSGDPALINIAVQVFDTDGAQIASSKGAQELNSYISRKDFISVLQGKDRFDTINFENPYNRMTFRVYTTPVFENDKVAFLVQVASPLTSIYIALNQLKLALFLLFPATVLVMGLMGSFLVKATLRPVDSIIRAIHEITAENLKMKLAVPHTKDEIQKLAETFNDMLKRLEHAFTSQRRLFEDLSHELKTPLTILKGELEVTLKKIRTQEEYGSILRSSLEEIDKMANLVENLLLLARFDLKEIMPERKKFDLNLLMRSVVNSLKPLYELKEIAVSFIERDDVNIYGDEEELKTLFINIIDNAIKYTPEGGSVQVMSERADKHARITIKDTGKGIPRQELAHIFDRFYRGDKARTSSGGFGLGLSIAKAIVEAHGGSISVESEFSKGTTFIITLPI